MTQIRLNKIKGFTTFSLHERGFTLIELLVVMSIIAILSVIGFTMFTSAQANARDARRKIDIDAIQNAIETTRTPGTVYYTALPASGFTSGVVPVDNNAVALKPHYCIRTSTATSVPADPTIANWAASALCPTSPAASADESMWTDISPGGLPFASGTIAWKACARLETGTIYCKPSSQ